METSKHAEKTALNQGCIAIFSWGWGEKQPEGDVNLRFHMIRHSRTCECPGYLNPRGSVCFVLSMVEVVDVRLDFLTQGKKSSKKTTELQVEL